MANKLNDLTGQVFGRLTVIERDTTQKYPKPKWFCQCECGTIKSIAGRHLTAKTSPTRSCGCLAKEKAAQLCAEKLIDLTGQTFNYLTVQERYYKENDNKVFWKCRCICGKEVIIRGDALKTQISCGCKSISKGELLICNLLNELNIEFETQKTFNDLKDLWFLRFDFFIPSLNILIEYQGEQHYYETDDYFTGTLQDRQRKDEMKREYCLNNNIKLIEIPYWDYSKLNKEYLLNLFS